MLFIIGANVFFPLLSMVLEVLRTELFSIFWNIFQLVFCKIVGLDQKIRNWHTDHELIVN